MDLVARGFGLLEGPSWLAEDDSLCFADTVGGGVWRLAVDGSISEEVPGRRGIGGLASHRDGGFVVSGKNVSWRRGIESVCLLPPDQSLGLLRFNDLATDVRGRVYVGQHAFTMEHERTATLPAEGVVHLIDLDGSARVVAHNVSVANGMGFAPDWRLLYVVDTGRRRIDRFTVDEDGDLHNRHVFHEFGDGRPDGLAVSEDGSLWVALAGEGAMVRLSSKGVVCERLEIPDRYPTSACFGGRDLRTLFITTAGEGGYQHGRPDGGIFATQVAVPGVSVIPAAVPIGA